MQTIADKIVTALRRKGRGYVFTPHDLLHLGTRAGVDQALSRLAKSGEIRRLGRGVYDYPKVSASLGPLAPPADAIVRALARKEHVHFQASGATAANALGLSTQVPGRITFLTDGTSRTRHVGSYTIKLKRANPRKLLGAETTAGAVLQAIRYLGPRGTNKRVIQHLNALLRVADKRELRRLATSAPGWAQSALRQIATNTDPHIHSRDFDASKNRT